MESSGPPILADLIDRNNSGENSAYGSYFGNISCYETVQLISAILVLFHNKSLNDDIFV